MRTAALTVLLALGTSGTRAADVASSTAAPAAVTAPAQAVELSTPAARPPYAPPPEVKLAVYSTALLAEKGDEVPADKLAAFLPELAKFNERLQALLGRDLLEAAAARDAQNALRSFRSAIQLYYAAFSKYPETPEVLVPGYLPAIPELRLPGHTPSTAVAVVREARYDAEPGKAAGDSGGWLYFYADGSANRGLLMIDCTHKDREGKEYSGY